MSFEIILAIVGTILSALIGKAWLNSKSNPPPLDIEDAIAKPDHVGSAVAKGQATSGPSKKQLEDLAKDGKVWDARQRERNK